MDDSWVEEVEEKGLGREGKVFRQKYIELMKGELREGVCRYSQKFEEIARKKGKEKVGEGNARE